MFEDNFLHIGYQILPKIPSFGKELVYKALLQVSPTSHENVYEVEYRPNKFSSQKTNFSNEERPAM